MKELNLKEALVLQVTSLTCKELSSIVGKIPGLYCQFVGLSSQLVKLAVTLKCLPKKQKPEWRGEHCVTVDSEQAWPLGSVAGKSPTGICNHMQAYAQIRKKMKETCRKYALYSLNMQLYA